MEISTILAKIGGFDWFGKHNYRTILHAAHQVKNLRYPFWYHTNRTLCRLGEIILIGFWPNQKSSKIVPSLFKMRNIYNTPNSKTSHTLLFNGHSFSQHMWLFSIGSKWVPNQIFGTEYLDICSKSITASSPCTPNQQIMNLRYAVTRQLQKNSRE